MANFHFLSSGLLVLVLVFLVVFACIFSLGSGNLDVLVLLRLRLVFLTTLLLTPTIVCKLTFFSKIQCKCFLVLVVLIDLTFCGCLFVAGRVRGERGN